MERESKEYWETIYNTKNADQMSWTQSVPKTSLDFIESFGLSRSASIIDIGGGDSNLVDHLIEKGFENITVLDISQSAIDKAKKRLGKKGESITWIASDILEFNPDVTYDIWHDRATFHFLTTASQSQKYLETARKAVSRFLSIGTFSHEGPTKCSGLDIKQYSEESLVKELSKGFKRIRCIEEDHITPFNTVQNFIFCSFKRTE